MNHYVPDFDPNADYSLHSSSEQNRHRKSSIPDDEIIELLWQNGQLVMQSQNQRSVFRKSQPSKLNSTIPADHSAATEMRALQQQEPEEQHLFMQEDEMASWLHYPLVEDASLDNNFCSELLYPTPPQCLSQNTNPSLAVRSSRVIENRPPATLSTVETTVTEVTPRPPIPSIRSIEPENKVHNFPLFSSHKPRANTTGPSSSKSVAMESTMVGSNDTPAVEPISPAYEMERRSTRDAANRDFGCRMINSGGVAGTSSSGGGGIGMTAYELSLTSSSGISRTSTEPTSQTQTQTQAAEGRKRKANETEATEFQNEGADFDFADAKKQGRGMASTNKRARAAEVHNLSERRRRDRINEKMKALQELIPRCNKTDKASMLDEAIDYLKSLQLQVQMMAMGCGMMPMMYPGVQHFMPNMGMGLGMGMGIGMGMDMSINRPMMPYPNMFAGSALPRPSAASQLGPGYPMPPFPMHPVPNSDPYRIQHPNQSDHMLNSVRSQGINQPGVSTFVNSYQQFSGPSQMQLHHPQSAPQNQPEPSSRNQCSIKGSEVISNYPSG